MKKFAKKIIASVLILFFFLSAIFCCCLTGTAQAGMNHKAEQGNVDGSRCCPDKTKNADSEKIHECKCEKVAEILVIKGFNLSKVVDSLRQLLDRPLSFSGKTSVSDHGFAQNHILRASIQVVKSDPPIYLQDSVLRL